MHSLTRKEKVNGYINVVNVIPTRVNLSALLLGRFIGSVAALTTSSDVNIVKA